MKKNNKISELLNKKGFYIAIYSSAAVIVAIAGIISYTNVTSMRTPKKNSVAEAPRIPIEEPVNKSDVKSYMESTTQGAVEKATEKSTDLQKTENVTETASPVKKNEQANPSAKNQASAEPEKNFTLFDDSKEMQWPVSGQILMDYSVETAVYDKTLDQYRTHDSLCISADIGTPVAAAADGRIQQIYNSNETGTTVVINHGNGWLSTYGQLADISVSEGEIVSAGQNIAKIAQPTRCSVALGTHLDFKLTKDNSSTDPKLMLAQLEE